MKIIRIHTVDSTNNHAKSLIQTDEAEHNLVIVADEQTAGRGQQQNGWSSASGQNLTFSLIIEPKSILPQNQFIISKAVALGVSDYLQGRLKQEDVFIKWPNDIYVGLEKICGILIETSIIGNQLSYAAIGIGININQTIFPEYIPNPTSLKKLTQKDRDLEKELNNALSSIDAWLQKAYKGKTDEINQTYLHRLLFFNELREYVFRNQKIKAKIVGINNFGHLQIQNEASEIFECDLKELVYLF